MPACTLPCVRRAVLATVVLVTITVPVATGSAWLAAALFGADAHAVQVASDAPAAADRREH